MRKSFAIGLLILIGIALSGCVATVGTPTYSRPTGVYASTPPAVLGTNEYVPPGEYVVEGAPVYYDIEPGIAFYPMFLDFPGSCFCIMPVRYVGGIWYAPGHVEVYRGFWNFHRPAPVHLNAWHDSRGAFRGSPPAIGRIDRGRPLPPPGIHAQPRQFAAPVPARPSPGFGTPPPRAPVTVQPQQVGPPAQPPLLARPPQRQVGPSQQQPRPPQQIGPQQRGPGPAQKCPPNQRC